MAGRAHQGQTCRSAAGGVCRGVRRHRLQFLAVHPGQYRRRPVRREGVQFDQDHWTRPCHAGKACRAGFGGDAARLNGILVITYYNEVRAEGMTPVDAMFHAATQRMRPMLMTALSACIGGLPAAVATGIGSQVQRPLAVVVVAGMLIGPIMLLVVAPALQVMFLGSGRASPTAGASEAATGDVSHPHT